MHAAALDDLQHKVWTGQRIDAAEALRLYDLPLNELGALADRRRQLARAAAYDGRGNEIVTYIVDRNVNYTNVCNVYCKFCAFYRTEKDDDAYVISNEEMDRKMEETVALGGTQILLQGGHHPKLTKQWYLDLLGHMKAKFPQVNIHGFSPSEFVHFREVFNEPLEKLIADFVAAGLGSIPGGGGEILVDRVRQRISPLKSMSNDWLEVMDVAHRLGLSTTATMMFGHVETRADRLEHLERLRVQQDKSLQRGTGFQPVSSPGHQAASSAVGAGELKSEIRNLSAPALPTGEVRSHPGNSASPEQSDHEKPLAGTKDFRISDLSPRPSHFTAFIGWTFQPEHTKLRAPTVGAAEYLRTQALTRIYLDNFPSVQSSWVTQGPEIGQVALKFGANDLGSIMIEENVVSQAGATYHMTVADMQRLIRDLGYEPRQRDNWYRLV
jgi:2-iminoacetate synthase ThiH